MTSGGTPASYTVGGSAVAVDSGVKVVTGTDADITSAAMVLTNPQSGDTLNFTSQNGITGSYSSGTLTLSGTATVADYQTALQCVTFSSSNTTNPSPRRGWSRCRPTTARPVPPRPTPSPIRST